MVQKNRDIQSRTLPFPPFPCMLESDVPELPPEKERESSNEICNAKLHRITPTIQIKNVEMKKW
jgi:hypothetical protein